MTGSHQARNVPADPDSVADVLSSRDTYRGEALAAVTGVPATYGDRDKHRSEQVADDIPWRFVGDVPFDGFPPPVKRVTPDPGPKKICCMTCRDEQMVQVCGYSVDGGVSISESEYMDDWYLGGRIKCNVPCLEEEEDVCGMDATKAVEADIERHIGSARQIIQGPRDIDFIHEANERRQGRHGPFATILAHHLSYKWMDFSGEGENEERCGGGKCAGTVGFHGACVPQNVLGNYAAARVIAAVMNVTGDNDLGPDWAGWRRLIAELLDVPIGGRRRDNVVAVALGTHAQAAAGSGVELPQNWMDMTPEQLFDLYASYPNMMAFLNLLTGDSVDGWAGRPGYSMDDMTLTPKGVKTDEECAPCSSELDAVNGKEYFQNTLMPRFVESGRPTASLDDWLEEQVPDAIRRTR